MHASESWTRAIAQIGAADVGLVGGKAANLGEMVRAGLPMPPGFCVTADAYRHALGQGQLAAGIAGLLGRHRRDRSGRADSPGEEIRVLVEELPFPTGLAAEIGRRYRDLAHAMGLSDDPDGLEVAVRSSATAEDMPDASFAGQQETWLHVVGSELVLDRVKRCWASLWTDRAIDYRDRHGYDHRDVALAVVVQAMVPADVAGVLFTADPVGGDRSRMLVNASWGLGEAVVSGLVTPDTWTISKADLSILEHQVGSKELEVRRAPGGGTVGSPVPEERRAIASLDDGALRALATIGCDIERHYGMPMDVEWAWLDGRPWVLQARPITNLAAPQASYPEGHFDRSMFVEIFPDPLSPAFTSVVEPLFERMLDFTLRTLGFAPPTDIPAVRIFHHQPYFDQAYIEAALASLGPDARAVLVALMVNPFGRHQRGAPMELSLPFLRMGWRLLRWMRSLHHVLPREVERYRASVAELDDLDLGSMDEGDLLEHVTRVTFAVAHRLLDYDFLLIALVGLTYQALGSLLERYFDEEGEEIRARLVSGVTGNVTMETNIRIWDLSRAATASPPVMAALAAPGVAQVRLTLEGSAEGREFLAQLDGFLSEYGHRESRMDILYPTWQEDPLPLLSFVRSYTDAGDEAGPRHHQERLVAERHHALRADSPLPARAADAARAGAPLDGEGCPGATRRRLLPGAGGDALGARVGRGRGGRGRGAAKGTRGEPDAHRALRHPRRP